MKGCSLWSAVLAMTACLVPTRLGAGELGLVPAQLRYEPLYILEWVARRMNVVLRPDIPLPHILLESTTPLQRFQKAMAKQWGFVPHAFTNAYSAATNEIYLIDHAGYYGGRNRTVDDSLVHEFVHYLQARYFNTELEEGSLETEAVAIQQWFRAHHTATTASAARRVMSPSTKYSLLPPELGAGRHVD